jgi:hypothetical protein
VKDGFLSSEHLGGKRVALTIEENGRHKPVVSEVPLLNAWLAPSWM